MKKIGFDNNRYLKAQSENILRRVGQFKGKLYLEFGGKLFYDYHAARVLPGYDPNAKVKVLKELKDKIEFLFCISAKDIQSGRIRGDFGLTYDNITLKSIEDLQNSIEAPVSVVITRFTGEKKALVLKNHLEHLNIKVYMHREIEGYPSNIDIIISDEGYGANTYIETKKPIVVVTGAGPGSGKMSTCLSQVYLDGKRGLSSGFAKWETFPIWNIPLEHPVNIAYEAATADIGDFNLVDPFHLAAYNQTSINYNRDVENFDIVKAIIAKIITKDNPMASYRSPTDMGVNMAKEGIVDDSAVQEAARQEIIRRWFRYHKELTLGTGDKTILERMEKVMRKVNARVTDREVVEAARRCEEEAKGKAGKGHKGIYVGAALQFSDGTIITGKNSPFFHAESAVIMNAAKKIANVPDNIDLISQSVVKQITQMKENILGDVSPSMDLEETLVALSISASMNPMAEACIKALSKLKGCEMHITYMPKPGDESGLRKIGLNYTTDCKLTLQHYL